MKTIGGSKIETRPLSRHKRAPKLAPPPGPSSIAEVPTRQLVDAAVDISEDVLRRRAQAAQRARARADGGADGGDAHAREVRRQVSVRLRQAEAEALFERRGGRPPAKVAIIGAGPTGLWLAVLLARKHCNLAHGPHGLTVARHAAAPTIHVFEKRQPADRGTTSKPHGGRSIVLAITQHTHELLNRQLMRPNAERSEWHAFAPTSRIGAIEQILAGEFAKYVAAGLGALHCALARGFPVRSCFLGAAAASASNRRSVARFSRRCSWRRDRRP